MPLRIPLALVIVFSLVAVIDLRVLGHFLQLKIYTKLKQEKKEKERLNNMIQQAKERREIINQQQHELLGSIPKGLDRGWADPLPDSNERLLAAELVGIGMRAYERPEWKVQAFGKVPTFGRISTK
ncbi:MAG: hypothetical protein EZS28_033808, partial [Streblomastix strix]